MIRPRSPVLALFRMELRTLLRDRRTVALSIVLPMVVMPVILAVNHWQAERRTHQFEEHPVTYAIEGTAAQTLRDLVAQLGVRRLDGHATASPRLQMEERAVAEDPRDALDNGDVDLVLSATAPERGNAGLESTVLDVRIVFRSDRDISRLAANLVVADLEALRQSAQYDLLKAAGFPGEPSAIVPIHVVDLATGATSGGLVLGKFATLLLLFFLFSGGAVVAQDTLAGEKERGTLETLLTTAITRGEIVAAKVLLVLAVAIGITAMQAANLLAYVGLELIPSTSTLTVAVGPALALGLLAFVIPLAALVAGALVLVSGYSRSYREAQLYFLPLLLVAAVPAMAAWLPQASLRSALVLIPIANISVGVKELLAGRVDLTMLAVAWVVTASAAAATLVAATRTLSAERLIVPAASQAGIAGNGARVGPRHVVTWFAAMWAIVFLTSTNLGADFDIRGQVVVNVVVVFLGGSLLFIRRHGLDAKTVLSWRLPHPSAWIAVFLGVPAGLVTGIGILRLSQTLFPAPPEVLQAFGQLVPAGVPIWQLVPLMTILPGVCEEIAFRGVLLHGLRQSYSRLVTSLLVGVVFGLFHFSVFRIAQTAYLGVLLAAVTMMSGSIFPAMVWHAGSNALALVATRVDVGLDRLGPLAYAGAAVVLCVCFWILHRGGSPRVHGSNRPPAAFALVAVLGAAGAQTADPVTEGRAALARGDARRAITIADAMLVRSPLAADALSLKVDALASANDWETALDTYEGFLRAGGREDVEILQRVGVASLREAIVFFPTLRLTALGRLACGGDRDALLELRRAPPPRAEDIDAQITRARLGDFSGVLALRDLATNGSSGGRALALQALAQLKDRGAEPVALGALEHPDASVRVAGARLARVLRLQSATTDLRTLAAEPHPVVAVEATAALAVLGDANAAARVEADMGNPGQDVRLAALAALLELGPSQAVLDAVAAIARLRTSSAWATAVELLIPKDPTLAAAAVREALLDENPTVRIFALRFAALVPMIDVSDVPRLRTLLRDPNPFVRLEAAAVLATRSRMCAA